MSTGFLFPGQGSQKLGMLADIPEMYMERLENVTGYRLVDKEENYQDTVFIQLALLTKAVFYLDEMEKNGIQPDIAAGHSIGAFCAAVACRSLTFENAAELVYHRAVLMKEAYPSGYAMGVVVGVTRSEAEEIVAKHLILTTQFICQMKIVPCNIRYLGVSKVYPLRWQKPNGTKRKQRSC